MIIFDVDEFSDFFIWLEISEIQNLIVKISTIEIEDLVEIGHDDYITVLNGEFQNVK